MSARLDLFSIWPRCKFDQFSKLTGRALAGGGHRFEPVNGAVAIRPIRVGDR